MNTDMEGRLSSAETAIKGLAESMTSLAHTVNVGFDRINDRIGSMSRPNWTLLTSLAGLAFVVIGGGVSWYIRDFDRSDRDSRTTTTEVISLGKAMAVAEYRLDQVQVGKEKLDETLQREMRLLDDIMKSDIRAAEALSQDRRNKTIAEIDGVQKQVERMAPDVAKFAERIDNVKSNMEAEFARIQTRFDIQERTMQGLAASVKADLLALRKEKP